MGANLIFLSAALLVATAVVHSILGEQKLLGPLLSIREGVLKSTLARTVIRFAWHLTSLSWLVLSVILVVLVVRPEQALHYSLLAVGLAFTFAGVVDAFATRGRHIGWPMLTAIGLFAFGAFMVGK